MTDYNDGKWHGWNGGECPVDPRAIVEAVWHDPGRETAGLTGPRRAKEDDHTLPTLAWAHVVRFRVTKPAPREWFITSGNCAWHTRAEAEAACDYGDRIIHVREVLPE